MLYEVITPVISYAYSFLCCVFFLHKSTQSGRKQLNISSCELFSYDCAPAAGPKLNHCAAPISTSYNFV